MTGYENLEVTKKSIKMVTSLYQLLKRLPKEKVYALPDQMRRSAVAVTSHITTGSAKHSKKEFIEFLNLALTSLAELQTQLLIAKKIGFMDNIDPLRDETQSIKKMLHTLITSLKKSL